MKLAIRLLCILPLFFACKTTQYTPATFKGPQLVAGSSGGVSGMLKEYILLENGHLFMSKGIKGEWKELRILKQSKTKEIFNTASTLGLDTLKFRHPGNMTYYLNLKHPPHSNEVSWGESGIAPPEGISKFYSSLIAIF